METVSQAWKQEQQKTLITAESFIEITLNVGDPDSQADAEASDNGASFLSNTAQIVDEVEKNPVKYETLEKNLWVLDGTFKYAPSSGSYGDNGYIGSLVGSGEGTYSEAPTLTIRFSKVYEALIPGLTITWADAYEEWADTFRITAYNGASVVAEKTVSGNKELTSPVEIDIQGYDRLTIEVLRWCLPYRRARVSNVLIGIERIFKKNELMSYKHSLFCDPLSASLPKAEISFTLSNLNGQYNPDNPMGSSRYLMERQEISVRYGYKLGGEIEWIPGGVFYMSEWDTPQNGITAGFTARDALEFMSDAYTGPKTGTLYSIAEAAFEQAELPKLPNGSARWIVDESLKSMSTPAEVSLEDSVPISSVLQYVANAACCVFYQDRSGIIYLKPAELSDTDYRIDQFNSFANSEISLTKQLKSVNINNGQYILSVGQVGETQTVSNPFISDNRAQVVAAWIADYLKNRRVLSGNFRADPRLDALDVVTNENQFTQSDVLVTEIEYAYNGAFRGSYEGRAIPSQSNT